MPQNPALTISCWACLHNSSKASAVVTRDSSNSDEICLPKTHICRAKASCPFVPADTSIEYALSTTILYPEAFARSEEHTSELQSQSNLVCRLLLEKKK